MVDILKTSTEQGRGIVTAMGKQVKIYTSEAKGTYPIQGCVLEEGFDQLSQWLRDGKHANTPGYNLELYTTDRHFAWGDLPSWANYCILFSEEGWVCGSRAPEYIKEQWVFPTLAQYVELPDWLTQDILIQDVRGKVFINPKYNQ